MKYYVVFFFKQKTAYEMLRSLVGSEMCIRDRTAQVAFSAEVKQQRLNLTLKAVSFPEAIRQLFAGSKERYSVDPALRDLKVTANLKNTCLLYTSDAADDLLCVDLGGRRIIKKKKKKNKYREYQTVHELQLNIKLEKLQLITQYKHYY